MKIDIEDATILPNCVITRRLDGKFWFMPLDESGKLIDGACAIITTDAMPVEVGTDTMLFVHAISGEEAALTKLLFTSRIGPRSDGAVIPVIEIAKRGELQNLVTVAIKDYMDGNHKDRAFVPLYPKES